MLIRESDFRGHSMTMYEWPEGREVWFHRDPDAMMAVSEHRMIATEVTEGDEVFIPMAVTTNAHELIHSCLQASGGKGHVHLISRGAEMGVFVAPTRMKESLHE